MENKVPDALFCALASYQTLTLYRRISFSFVIHCLSQSDGKKTYEGKLLLLEFQRRADTHYDHHYICKGNGACQQKTDYALDTRYK